MDDIKLGKTISHALRHKPEDYGLVLAEGGWVALDELVAALNRMPAYAGLTARDIEQLLARAVKKRHEISDGRIRALHGHSAPVENASVPVPPPEALYHATALKYWPAISTEGLKPMRRLYVHLAVQPEGALVVARGKYREVVLLRIEAARAYRDGIRFYSNDPSSIWLSGPVPADYISIEEQN